MCVCVLVHFYHYNLLQDVQYSSLGCIVGHCCLSVLHIVVCICCNRYKALISPSLTPFPLQEP